MAAYVIADIYEIRDPDTYSRYRRMVLPTIEQFGGRFLVRGGQTEVLEGGWDPGRIVIIEFESYEKAQAWYASQAYSEAKALRQSVSTGSLILVEGVS